MLSVIIITKNEEHNIERCLQSVKWAEEIIVVDSGSTDKTVELAKNYTDRVYEYLDWQGYGVQKQRALDHARGEWILNLDADEVVSQSLCHELKQLMDSGLYDACRVPIQMNFYNKPLYYSSSPQRHNRLFKRAGARFSSDLVHEKILLPGETRFGSARNSLMHHSFKDVSHALYKLNRYSSYTAASRLANKKSTSFSYVLFGATWMFLRCYFFQLGFLDGKPGFFMAAYNAQGTFYRGIKQLYPDKEFDSRRASNE